MTRDLAFVAFVALAVLALSGCALKTVADCMADPDKVCTEEET